MQRPRVLSLALTLMLAGCIEPAHDDVAPPPAARDADVHAELCALSGENVAAPVKVLVALDLTRFADDGTGADARAAVTDAVRAQVESFTERTDVFVATVGASSSAYTEPNITSSADPMFVPAAQWSDPAFLQLESAEADGVGALQTARSMIMFDLLASDAALAARTKYVVLLVSDGAFAPRCCAADDERVGSFADPFDCAPEAWEELDAEATYCDGTPEPAQCNDADALVAYREAVAAGAVGAPDFGDGAREAMAGFLVSGNYGRAEQMASLAGDIVETATQFGARASVSTLLYQPADIDDAELEARGINRCRDTATMQEIAQAGAGEFRPLATAAAVTLAGFGTGAQPTGRTLASVVMLNQSALPGRVADTDGDGVPDSIDADPSARDSDDDGYRDGLAAGPACPESSPLDTIDRRDLDADGLNGCEEVLLGSDPINADTNGDGVPDGVAVRFGLDPSADSSGDSDLDGASDRDEIVRGTDPRVSDADELGSLYRVSERGVVDGRLCYALDVTRAPIALTASGVNRIALVVSEVPAANPSGRGALRIACADVPVGGATTPQVTFTDDDFLALDDPVDLEAIAIGASGCIP